jgi:ribonuclease J
MNSVNVLPLGGLGEVGMNCMVLEHGHAKVVVDCGVMFPERERGVDQIHPNFDYLVRHASEVQAVVLTHGHEDHIGALPYLLRRLSVPVYGPPYALALVRERLREFGLEKTVDLRRMTLKQPVSMGPFEVESIAVTHSIVDSTALVFRTPDGVVFHSGDFTMDPAPFWGPQYDEARVREVGRDGVLLLLSDSTNVDVPTRRTTETSVVHAVERHVLQARGRVIVGMFASNVGRLRGVVQAAKRAGRKVCLLGRSVHTHVQCASELGYLSLDREDLISAEEAQRHPRDKFLAIATGSQGEQNAALSKLATGAHPALALDEDDTVIFSSRVIPGHELAVQHLISQLEWRGVRVIFHHDDPEIHTSGHAGRDEQKKLIDMVQPHNFIPIHGTHHHLVRHGALARAHGVPHVQVIENGVHVQVRSDGVRRLDTVPTDKIHVRGGDRVPDVVLQDRDLLGKLGIAVVVVISDEEGLLLDRVELLTRGVFHEDESATLLDEARDYVAHALRNEWRDNDALLSDDGERRETEARSVARRALKRFFKRRLPHAPLTYAITIDVQK